MSSPYWLHMSVHSGQFNQRFKMVYVNGLKVWSYLQAKIRKSQKKINLIFFSIKVCFCFPKLLFIVWLRFISRPFGRSWPHVWKPLAWYKINLIVLWNTMHLQQYVLLNLRSTTFVWDFGFIMTYMVKDMASCWNETNSRNADSSLSKTVCSAFRWNLRCSDLLWLLSELEQFLRQWCHFLGNVFTCVCLRRL